MLKAKFDFIRYANCWEDADLLLAALKPEKGSSILSIASAGDNSLALLTTGPKSLVAIDINPIQLYLTELKALCFKELNYTQTFDFLSSASAQNIKTYEKIKMGLSENARVYWDSNLDLIKNGIVFGGKFEKYLLVFGRKILPFIHSKKTTIKLFEPKTSAEQKAFYENSWNNLKWKLLFRIFFNRKILGMFGRDPEFLKQVEMRVSTYLFENAAAHLSSLAVQKNYFLAFMLMGKFKHGLPYYLRPENFEAIKANIHTLKLQVGYAQDAIAQHGTFTHFNFSNIFEYMTNPVFEDFVNTINNKTKQGAKFAFWNLMVNREFTNVLPQNFEKIPKPQMVDNGFFYKEFITQIKR